MTDTLGVAAHPGGLLADRPELSVGVVALTARRSGLELDVIARRGPATAPPAERVLLPAYDEGLDLRVGRLTDGHAEWVYAVSTAHNGDDELRAVYELPPQFGHIDLVLAWPEIGFGETVIGLPLPARSTVERADLPVWRAPVAATEPAPGLPPGPPILPADPPRIETGRLVAGPLVLARAADAVIVLARVTAVAGLLAVRVRSVARGAVVAAIERYAHPAARDPVPGVHEPAVPRLHLLRDGRASELRPSESTYAGGGGTFTAIEEFLMPAAPLDLVVSWPAAGVPAGRVHVPWT